MNDFREFFSVGMSLPNKEIRLNLSPLAERMRPKEFTSDVQGLSTGVGGWLRRRYGLGGSRGINKRNYILTYQEFPEIFFGFASTVSR